jgi:hypothetical protein
MNKSDKDNSHASGEQWLLSRLQEDIAFLFLLNETDSQVFVVINRIELMQELETDNPLSAIDWETICREYSETQGAILMLFDVIFAF